MSVVDKNGIKIVLPSPSFDGLWAKVQDEYAGDCDLRWRYLAMLALRENSGWSLERIGRVFHHSKGHVSRCLRSIRKDLRQLTHEPNDRDPATQSQ